MSHQPPETVDDLANGWNQIAPDFMAIRQHSVIGVAVISLWAKNLPVAANVLDLGCGFGVPLTATLISQGFSLYGIDASPVLLTELQQRFPQVLAKCATVEEADFRRNSFARAKVATVMSDTATFDAVMAIGLMFLLPAQSQQLVIKKVAEVLNQGGFFFIQCPISTVLLARFVNRQGIKLLGARVVFGAVRAIWVDPAIGIFRRGWQPSFFLCKTIK